MACCQNQISMNRTILFSLLLLLLGCNRPELEPEFLGIKNIEVTKVTGTEAFLKGEALFHNPNDTRMKLKYVDVSIELEGKKIGTIQQDLTTKIPALSRFTVPLNATFDLTEIGLLNSIIGILGGKKMAVRYKGHIRVSMYGYPMTVPVDFEEEVRI